MESGCRLVFPEQFVRVRAPPQGQEEENRVRLHVAHPPRDLVDAVRERPMLTDTSWCFSAKDKAILEAAYNANPKPDKAARLDIVKRVSLNEKEVQVRVQWAHPSFLRALRAQLVLHCPVVSITDRIRAPDMVPEQAPE